MWWRFLTQPRAFLFFLFVDVQLYGRGGADGTPSPLDPSLPLSRALWHLRHPYAVWFGGTDGYAIFGAITAIRAVQEQGAAHPRCVVLIEGGEESDVDDLKVYIRQLHSRIGALQLCLHNQLGQQQPNC